MEREKVVSAFEFAIMQAVHETQPDKVTASDLQKVRPKTREEESQERQEKEFDFLSKIKCRTEEDQKIWNEALNQVKNKLSTKL